MAQTCPIPDVDRALSPYISPREDTLRVRRTLSKYLTASLRPVNAATQNQHLNHESPRNLAAVGTNPPGLKGSRGAYLDAIRAHKAAQTKLKALQASLGELQQRHFVENPVDDSYHEDEVAQSYTALLRQRRRLAELEIVQESLEKLLNVSPIEGLRDARELVKDAIGEQPDLPAERIKPSLYEENNASLVLRLKKEVLESRSRMDGAKAARSKAHSVSREIPGLEAQVYALARAREEIVEWVQVELAKMEEASGFLEDASPVKRPVTMPSGQNLDSSESQIRSCYDQYTTSRTAAIEGHQSFHQHSTMVSRKNHEHEDNIKSSVQHVENPQSKVSITSLLPYLPHIAQNGTNERLTLLHAAFLQNQISSADADTTESLSRLSGESHLLRSGSKGIEAWGKTVVELEALHESSVRERIQSSRSEINNISTIVDVCSLQSKVLGSQ